MRNNFVYSYSIKIHVLRFDKFMESIFNLLLVVEVFSLQKVVKMLEEVAFAWWEVRWIWWMKHNFVVQLAQLLKRWLWDMQLGVVLEKNWALSLTNAGCKHWNRPPNSDQDLFFCCQFSFGKDFGASSWSNHWAGHCWLSYKIHFSSHVTIWSGNGSLLLQRLRDDTSKWYFLTCSQLRRHPVLELSHLTNLLQIPKDHRMVDTEFFRNFLFSCKRISFDDCS